MRLRPGDDRFHALVHLAEIESAGTGRVRIAVAAYRLTRTSAIEALEHFAAAAPIIDARALQMRDDDWNRAPLADHIGLFHRVENAVGLSTHVGGIDASGIGE